YWGRAYASADEGDIGRILARARELASLSAADDPVIAVGQDWSPDLFYYAHRRGFMLADWLVDLPAASGIDFSRYTILHAWDPDRGPLWPASRAARGSCVSAAVVRPRSSSPRGSTRRRRAELAS